jgi:predicted ATPase
LERFDLNVSVTEFQDIIHNIKVTQNQLLLDIPDVGFGISQVLPILVEGMMAPSKSTIIMEQPEIHLHPMMQAELADLFIDILQLQTKSKSRIRKHLIIETHSEYILKRIRRRMAEGLISPKHVAIYFVKPRNKENPETAEINLAPISKDGTIEWPRDFYITEIEDEMAFFKSKISKS